jgi:threonine dehydrogenase-like Zn-dependent dehydrogenase
MKGAKEVVAIDTIPARLKMAVDADPSKVKTIDFNQVSNIPAKIAEWYPDGVDVYVSLLSCAGYGTDKFLCSVVSTLVLSTSLRLYCTR